MYFLRIMLNGKRQMTTYCEIEARNIVSFVNGMGLERAHAWFTYQSGCSLLQCYNLGTRT